MYVFRSGATGGSMRSVLVILLVLFMNQNYLLADEPVAFSHLGTLSQQQRAMTWNRAHGNVRTHWSALRPFSEIENTGFVAISAKDEYELSDLRTAIAQNLPDGVSLVVSVTSQDEVAPVQSALGQYLTSDRLKFLMVPSTGDPVWSRDSFPFPVYLSASPASFGLVASIYPQNFDPNQAVDNALGLPMTNTNQEFRGGNLLFDLKGNCFSENVNEVASLTDPESFFKQYFGCSTVTLLQQEGGIGDIDERLKFLSGNIALTDNATYQSQLAQKGYDVKMIPTTGNDMETYMNTLVVNGTIFVPQMGISSDADAVQAYTNLGFKAVGVYTKDLAVIDQGNIHCLTMNYPPGAFVASGASHSFVKFSAN
jgi:hypothetical protein